MMDALTGPLGRLNGRVTLWLARCAAFVLGFLAVLTFCDVLGRYLFNHPFSVTVELTELGMGIIVYFSVGLVTHEKGHVAVDAITMRLPGVVRAAVDLVINLLAFAYLCFVVWRMFLRAGELYAKADYTPIWYIPLWPVAVAMSVASILFLTGILLHILAALQRIKRGGDTGPDTGSGTV